MKRMIHTVQTFGIVNPSNIIPAFTHWGRTVATRAKLNYCFSFPLHFLIANCITLYNSILCTVCSLHSSEIACTKMVVSTVWQQMNQRHRAWDNHSQALFGEIKSRAFLHLPVFVWRAEGLAVSLLEALHQRRLTGASIYKVCFMWMLFEIISFLSLMSCILSAQLSECKRQRGKCPPTWTLTS